MKTEYERGWDAGWEACESFYEQSILSNDPGFRAWLDGLEQQARRERASREETTDGDPGK